MTDLRIGHGYDVHRLAEGRRLVLGGVEIPWEKGLLGHSDADVLTHAVMDALCGAAKLGDIGKLFPDTDPRYAGISSLELLGRVAALLAEGGWTVVNVDATLLAQAPKVGPFRRADGGEPLPPSWGSEADRVNVKATTEEGGLPGSFGGPPGRGTAETAQWRPTAVVLLGQGRRRVTMGPPGATAHAARPPAVFACRPRRQNAATAAAPGAGCAPRAYNVGREEECSWSTI